MSLPLYDDFDNPLGEFIGYDTYDAGQRAQLALQRHVDIRSFDSTASFSPLSMATLDGTPYVMYDDTPIEMDAHAMSYLEGAPIGISENWSAGTLGLSANSFNALSLTCTTGTNVTQSVMDPISLEGVADGDITLALPNWPLASVTASQCFIDLTSHPSGDFTVGPTDSLPFSSSTTTLAAGDSEARFPVSACVSVDLAKITGIRFRIQATGSCTFQCMAIRAVGPDWQPAAVDQNTLYKRLGAAVPLTGSASPFYTFPAAASPVTPSDWPILFRSDGQGGPQAVDLAVGAVLTTGSFAAQSIFALYFRELAMLVNDIAAVEALDMAALDALGQQPDYTPGTLDDFAHSRWLSVSVGMGPVNSVAIKDQDGNGYDFSISLDVQSNYYFLVELQGNSLRATIHPISSIGVVDWSTVTFDSTAVVDSSFVSRRQGRFGWYASFAEGNAHVSALRPRRVVYGEYRTAPVASITPVSGARLYADVSPDIELFPGAVATLGATITPDVIKSNSGRSLQIKCAGNFPLQGLATPPLRFEDLYDTTVEFDVLAPSSATLVAQLRGENRILDLYLPPFPSNRWTHMTIPLSTLADTYMPGPYSLDIVQEQLGENIWYIDNLSISLHTVAWQGRAQAGDPWKMNDPAWIPFGDINDPFDGAMFGRGNSLQVRGQVVSQDGFVDRLQILPRYAELGNFVWADQTPSYATAPSPSFTTTTPGGHVATGDASASTATAGIAAYRWSFGDGSYGYGQTISHTYLTAGTYRITLTVVDNQGQKVATTHSVSV